MNRIALVVILFVVGTAGCVATRGRLTRETLARPAAPSRVAALQQRARELHLATSREWLRLGHWRHRWFGGYESEADGENFFLAKRGKTSPQAELDATIAGFFSDLLPYDPAEKSVQHPRCQFPARFALLAAKLGITDAELPAHDCSRFEEFKTSVAADSVTLVFSAYYLNNPASAFGHTFLRLGKTNVLVPEERRQLLDYGIDYSADPDTTFAPLYAVKGLAGAFPGTFRKVPFYFKVREYNDFESRDLWLYKLALTRAEIDNLVAHVWELGSTFFDYFYLTENCSYHILGLLEAAAPRLDLLDHLHWPVIPSDAVKAMFPNTGLVASVEFRPSSRTRFRRDLVALSGPQREAVARVASDPSAPLGDGDRQRIQVLDAAQDLVDLRYAKELVDTTKGGEGAELKQKLLERRAEILVPSTEPNDEPPWSKMPQRGHGSRRFGLGAGFDASSGTFAGSKYVTVNARLALHDLADPSDGYPELSQLEFLPTRLRYDFPGDSVHLDQLDIVHVMSLTSQDRFDRHMSWEFRIGSERLFDQYCFQCYAGLVQIGGGAALSAWNERATVFLLAETGVWGGPHLDGVFHIPVRVGLGPSGGLRLRLTSRLVTLVRAAWNWLPMQPDIKASTWSVSGVVRWMVANGLAIDVEATDDNSIKRGVASTLLYF